MNTPVRVLILEDSEIDKKIIFATIQNSDLEFTSLIVDTREGFIKALKEFHPDVVLSDYVLPDFDGMQALELHKEIIPETPFIFVTGQLPEETAIECLKLGAWDYIMKNHIKRLPVAITKVLELRMEKIEKQNQQKITIESERRYKSLSELTFEGIVIHRNGVVIDCNLSFCKMFGYERSELLNKYVIDLLVHPNDRNIILINIKKDVSTPYESRGIKKDGNIFPIEIEAKNITYNNEKVRVVALRDITSRKEALEELKLSEEKFNKISNAAKDAIILIDHKGLVSFWNNGATNLFQYSESEAMGKNLHKLITPDHYMEAHKKGFTEFLKTGEGNALGKTIELDAIRKDGMIIQVELSLSAIKMHGHWNAVGIIRDISSRKKFEADLLEAQRQATEMSQMKTNFLSTMSHELRTPLNGILGFSEILVECLDDKDFKDYATTIFKSSQRILNTFNLIIDLAVLDANKVSVNRKPENLINIIENACESYNPEALEKNLFLTQQIEVDEAIIDIDQTLLTQALNNLLNNAVKYTKHGSITVKLSETVENNNDCFLLTVTDTGIGIPEEKINVIYEAFRQASEGYSRSFEGMGLGLYITKKYVDLLDGIIEMKSEVNKGTEFLIYLPKETGALPLRDAPKQNASDLKSETLSEKKPKILYVEDDVNHCDFVKVFLKNDFDLTCANNANEALEFVRKNHFDLIMMDINLGEGMNGLEVVEIIRAMPSYQKTPIAAVTANALVSQKNTYLAQGCTDFIAKPFRKNQLIDFIENLLAG